MGKKLKAQKIKSTLSGCFYCFLSLYETIRRTDWFIFKNFNFGGFRLTIQAVCLTLHILNDNLLNVAEAVAIFQDFPRGVCVEVEFDKFVIADHQKTISFNVFRDIISDLLIREAFSFNQKLGVKFIFNHIFLLCQFS